MTLSDGATTLQLPALDWVDEYTWQPVEQSTKYALNGALLVDSATRLAGRPITLAPPSRDMAWMQKAALDQLYAWSESPELNMTLTLDDGRVFSVAWRHADGAIQADPVVGFRRKTAAPDERWLVTLRLMEI